MDILIFQTVKVIMMRLVIVFNYADDRENKSDRKMISVPKLSNKYVTEYVTLITN